MTRMEEALRPDNRHTVKALRTTSWHLTIILNKQTNMFVLSIISLNLYKPFQGSFHYVFALEKLIVIIRSHI